MRYKICFVGMGSIGKKHLLNLIKYAQKNDITLEIDILKKTLNLEAEYKKYIRNIFINTDDIKENYDIVFVVNPTKNHYETIKYFSKKAKNMFIEKPIFETSNCDYTKLELNVYGIYYVAAPLRHTSVFKELKNEMDNKKIYSVRAICSSYLPSWRPKQDYRETYSAHKAMGGGVSIDLIHEWDYIIDLFGFPQKVFNINGKYSDLEIDSDDISIYIGRYNDKTVELHLDYFGKNARREIELYTQNEVIKANFITKEIVIYSENIKTIKKLENNDLYYDEIDYFFNLIERKIKNINTIEKAIKVLKVAEGEKE